MILWLESLMFRKRAKAPDFDDISELGQSYPNVSIGKAYADVSSRSASPFSLSAPFPLPPGDGSLCRVLRRLPDAAWLSYSVHHRVRHE